MFSVVFVAFVLLSCTEQSSSSSLDKYCSNFKPMKNLETSKLTGKWFHIQRVRVNLDMQPDIRCLVENVEVDANGIFTIEFNLILSATNETKTAIYTGTPVDNIRSRYLFEKNNDPSKDEIRIILDTDHINYIIWLTCMTEDGYFAAIVSRQKTLSEELLITAKKTLMTANITEELNPDNQDSCDSL